MTFFTSKLSAGLAFAIAATSLAPAMAAPIYQPNAPVVSSDLVQVQSRRYDNRRFDNRNRFERRGNNAYFNGKRGYRQQRRGYREYNGFWFPAGAFIAGAIIGGAIANDRGNSNVSAHVDWCYDRWMSYRAADNTYQPSRGSRQQCYSPYS
jgi:hypothetical protein